MKVLSSSLNRLLPDIGLLRPLALAVGVNTIGGGLVLPLMALYAIQVVGLSVAQLTTALGIAALSGILSGVPLGHLADRFGPREAQVALLALIGVLSLGYLWISGFWAYTLIATAIVMLDRGVAAVGGALIAGSATGNDRTRIRVRLRTVQNAGIAVGSALSGIALVIGTPTAYRTMFALDAVTYLLSAWLYLRMPRIPPVRRSAAAPPWRVLRDRSYVVMTAVFSVLGLHRGMLGVALPLWVVSHSRAPQMTVSALIALHFVGSIVLLVPVSRRIDSTGRCVRATRVGGLTLFGACALFAVTPDVSALVAVTVLVVGAVLHLLGELLLTSAQFWLSFDRAPEHAQGQYQGLFTTGITVSTALAPMVMALLPLGLGSAGWILLGTIFASAAAAMGPLVLGRARKGAHAGGRLA